MSPEEIARMIDHANLKPEVRPEAIDRLCDEGVEYGFVAVCVNPMWVARCADRLKGTGVRLVSVVGFPFGAHRTETKVDEARRAIEDGAREIDMVIPLGALLAGQTGVVEADITALAEVTHAGGVGRLLKVILETGALTEEQIAAGCRCAIGGGADFVKTSTGFHPAGGARVEHVRLLKRYAAPLGVKASGGIRTAGECLAMIEAGASRIGTSSGPAIIEEMRQVGHGGTARTR